MDLQAIRDRINQLNNKTKKQGKIWKPKDEHDVRLLPQKNSDDPFIELKFHYDVSDRPILCPTNFGNECSVCEFAEKLRSWKDDDARDKPESIRKKDFEIFRKIQAKSKYFVAMVERGKEADGPMYWGITDRVYNQLLSICANEDWNADREDGGGSQILVSPLAGHDVHVSYKKPGEKGNKTTFHNVDTEERKKPTKLMPDKKDAQKLLDAVPSIDEVYPEIPSKEVHKLFMTFVNGGAAPAGSKEKPDTDGSEHRTAPSNNAEKLTGKKTIDEAFEELASSQ